MAGNSTGKVLLYFLLVTAATVLLSSLSVSLWGERPEILPSSVELDFHGDMTIRQFGEANQLPNPVLKEVFSLASQEEMQQTLSESGVPLDQLHDRVNGALALASEEATKNWFKIFIKFGLWAFYLVIVFLLIRKGRVTPRRRILLYLGAVLLFGVILGADPSPMGTVKDAVVLFGQTGVIFPPRMIAFSVMLVGGVILANKFLCGWGCQFGTLQDLIFRLNGNSKGKKKAFPQFRIPFIISNSIRVSVFLFMTVSAFLWALDIIDPVDPFKLFKPMYLGAAGIVSLALLLLSSLFIYRPWCHLLCPFGLVGWIFEKISINRIHVNYDTCIVCEACSKACPSTVMGAILKRDRVIPDCFACGTCIGVCPTRSISFKAGKRKPPPKGKFTGK